MNVEDAQEIAERDQLWASLRTLRAEIERIAADEGENAAPIVRLLARIVLAEMDYRARQGGGERPTG